MKTADLGTSASENLLETYFALGAASPAAAIRHESAYRICLSQANHPISNFAADLNLDANGASKLAQIAAGRPSFHVYRLPSDQPRHVAELLHQAGFRMGHALTQMAWTPSSVAETPSPRVELEIAGSLNERERVAAFMTEQFFAKQPTGFRRQVVDGTSRAERLELALIEDRNRPLGAVMLCETSETIGIYNLCVTAGMRNRGWGREIIRALKLRAKVRRKALVLQCESTLAPWYFQQEFKTVGFVEVFSFAPGSGLDIM